MRLVLCWILLLTACGCPSDDDDDSNPDDDDTTVDDDDSKPDDDDSAGPVDSDGDGCVHPEDCDDGDPAVHPGIVPTASLVDPELSWFWIGQDVEVAAVPVSFGPLGCAELVATSDQPWLSASVDPGGWMTVLLVGSSVVGGQHTGTVSLLNASTGSTLAAFDVELTALACPAGAPERRVLVVGLDGVRGDSVAPASTPSLDALAAHAAYTARASTQLEAATNSGPGWTSIATGVDADKHLITSNGGYEGRNPDYPSFLWRLRDAGFTAAVWTSWGPIYQDILEPDAADVGGTGSDAEVTAEVASALLNGDSRRQLGAEHRGPLRASRIARQPRECG